MINIFIGDCDFLMTEEVNKKVQDFLKTNSSLSVIKKDVDSITIEDIYNFVEAMSLFSEKQLIILNNLSDLNGGYEALLSRGGKTDNEIIVLDPKIDKRSKAYKEAKKLGLIKVFEKQSKDKVEAWALNYAKQYVDKFSKEAVLEIVKRSGYNEWQIKNSIDMLAPLDQVSLKTVKSYIEEPLEDSVYDLLTLAVNKKSSSLLNKIDNLAISSDPYMTMGFLISQVIKLTAYLRLNKNISDLMSLGYPSWMLKDVASMRALKRSELKEIIRILERADNNLKSTGADLAWTHIRQALIEIATI